MPPLVAWKNWGQPTLSQGAFSATKNAIPFAAVWTERAVPDFSPSPAMCSPRPPRLCVNREAQ